ncbi:hypothetical protein EOW77_0034325 [Bradyrhizobium yuanmingense]|uniref:hypothetical protein n=1 Tax=Bradyrhizobium yuanmingense TaxID=108015 RepID=UPI000FE391B1|nr:hypothetical protein [Bradyrhizobium yuanmingense]TGN74175.1 hypothetical protein EOW77_0034325 [Bradyrhizobium yuanmingense]
MFGAFAGFTTAAFSGLLFPDSCYLHGAKPVWACLRRAILASHVDKIPKGEQAGNLPVELPIKYDLVINVATAKTIDMDLPATLLARADQVIE